MVSFSETTFMALECWWRPVALDIASNVDSCSISPRMIWVMDHVLPCEVWLMAFDSWSQNFVKFLLACSLLCRLKMNSSASGGPSLLWLELMIITLSYFFYKRHFKVELLFLLKKYLGPNTRLLVTWQPCQLRSSSSHQIYDVMKDPFIGGSR